MITKPERAICRVSLVLPVGVQTPRLIISPCLSRWTLVTVKDLPIPLRSRASNFAGIDRYFRNRVTEHRNVNIENTFT